MAYATNIPVVRLALSDGFKFYGDATIITPSATVNLPVGEIVHTEHGETLTDGQVLPAQGIEDFTVPDPRAKGWTADRSHVTKWSYDVALSITATGKPPLLWTATISPGRNPEIITPGMGTVAGGPSDGAGIVTNTGPARLEYASRVYLQRLPKWKTALDAMRAGTRDARLLVVGDSTAVGVGGSSSSTFQSAKSWPAFMADELDRAKVVAQHGLATPKSASAAATADTRWAAGAGWTLGQYDRVGFGGRNSVYTVVGGATGTLTFGDPRIRADRFDIYYTTGLSTLHGTLEATATGGTAVTVDTSAPNVRRIGKVTVSAATAATTNTVTIRNTHATQAFNVVGVEPWLSTRTGVRVGNAGSAGSDTGTWTGYLSNNAGLTWSGIESIRGYAPDLTIIDLGINDAGNSVPASTYMANLQKLINAAAASGDVILKTMFPHPDPRLPYEQQYVDAVKGLGLPVIDMFGKYGSADELQAAEMMHPDGVHGNDKLYQDTGLYIASALPVV